MILPIKEHKEVGWKGSNLRFFSRYSWIVSSEMTMFPCVLKHKLFCKSSLAESVFLSFSRNLNHITQSQWAIYKTSTILLLPHPNK